MEVKQDSFDPHKLLFKIEADHVSVRPEETDSNFEKIRKFNFEPQSTEKFANACKIKQEVIECEEHKIEQLLDFPVKIEDISDVRDVLGTDLLLDKNSIKQEDSEHLQLKIKSELLTSYCDLPTLKDESTVYPDDFEQPCSSKQFERISNSLRTVHNKKKRHYTCPICLKSFQCSKSKLNHIVGHFGKRSANDRLPFWKEKQHKGNFGKYYQDCFLCGRFFLNRLPFLEHFILYHYVKKQLKSLLKCRYCQTVFIKQTILDEHMKIHTIEKVFKCEICSKTFDYKSKLINHLIIHNDSKSIRCEICSKQFSYSSYKRHVKIHSEEKPFNCEICSKTFRRKYSLVLHRKIHSEEKSFECTICSKQFRHKSSLNYHFMSHTKEKPFKCAICSKQFKRKCDLNNHLKIHTKKQTLKCEVCPKQFKQESYLQLHLKTHTGEKSFNCEICLKPYRSKRNYLSHLKIHSGEEPFKCELCSQTFSCTDTLVSHLNSHTEDMPFNCEICSKPFSRIDTFIRHLKIHAIKKTVQA